MKCFFYSLGDSFLACMLVAGVWMGYFLIAFLTTFPLFLIIFPFGIFLLDAPHLIGKISIMIDITLWGMLFINLPTWLHHRKKIKIGKINSSPHDCEDKKKEIQLGYTLLPLITFPFILFLLYLMPDQSSPIFKLQDSFILWYGIMPIFIVWSILSWQWARYRLKNVVKESD